MHHPFRTIACLTALFALVQPGHAANASIDSFGASSTSVKVGDTVDFWVQFSIGTSSYAGGGSNPVEPEPVEGYQTWDANWYSWEYETLRSVSLQSGGQSFYDAPSLSPGSSYGNTWSFSVTFTEAGRFDFGVTGSWEADVDSGYSNESASRYCDRIDPEDPGSGLSCSFWEWSYSDSSDTYSTGGSLGAGPLSIEVSAVPEPQTWALWLAGAGLLHWRARNRV